MVLSQKSIAYFLELWVVFWGPLTLGLFGEVNNIPRRVHKKFSASRGWVGPTFGISKNEKYYVFSIEFSTKSRLWDPYLKIQRSGGSQILQGSQGISWPRFILNEEV